MRLVLAVIVTCVVASTGLAVTYGVAAPRIAEQERLAEERSLKAVLPDADAFERVEDADVLADAVDAAGQVDVRAIYRATREGAYAGWGVKVASRGYAGPVQIVIGLDSDGKVAGVTILAHGETPGLGTRVFEDPAFMGGFASLVSGFDDEDVRALDVIAGSTKSSNAVRNGVAAAGRVYAEVLAVAGGGAR